MKYIFLFCMLLCLSSCATILNNKNQAIYFYTSKNKESIKVQDSLYKLPLRIEVPRSKNDLQVTLVTDTVDIDYTIKSRLDRKFVFLNLTGLYFAPINYGVDLTNSKRFVYQKRIYLNPENEDRIIGQAKGMSKRSRDRIRNYFTYQPNTNKGDFYLYGLIAPLNYLSFDLPRTEAAQSGFGVGGGEMGFSYYYTGKNYLSFGVGFNSNIEFLPVFNDFLLYSYTIKLANYHQLGRFNFGYGGFYGKNIRKEDIEYDKRYDYYEYTLKDNHNVVGILFAANYEVAKNLHIGLNYKLSTYQTSVPKAWANDHIVSFEVMYKLRLFKL